jgi:sortase A
VRRLGWTLIVAGLLVGGYVALVLTKGEPATGLYAQYEQHQLRRQLLDERPLGDRRTYQVEEGRPLGTIMIPAIGVDAVFVQGTDHGDLAKGPGHYANTALPGSGRVVAIAAHRTTYGAWFRHVDSLAKGDPIYLEFRGRSYRYAVTGHRVVEPSDWSIIRYRGYEKLVLSACHPVYSASHRWVVFARLVGSSRLPT